MADQSTPVSDPTAPCPCRFCGTPLPEGRTPMQELDSKWDTVFSAELNMYLEQLWQQAQAKKGQQPDVEEPRESTMLVAFLSPDEEVEDVKRFVNEFEDAFKLQESAGGRVPYLEWYYPLMERKYDLEGRYLRQQQQLLRNLQESLQIKTAELEQLRADSKAAERLEQVGGGFLEARHYLVRERELEEWKKRYLEETALFSRLNMTSHAETPQQDIDALKGMITQCALTWAIDRAFETESEPEFWSDGAEEDGEPEGGEDVSVE
ncbi:hypothetical protein FQN54_001114 [Arachnomyces sp. PD_36]|nr:hypothetical protein FQN54_001114 [Arachnomyces sp. PD_36]